MGLCIMLVNSSMVFLNTSQHTLNNTFSAKSNCLSSNMLIFLAGPFKKRDAFNMPNSVYVYY